MAVAEVTRKPEISEAEWDTRVNLAMLYRVIAKLRMTDLIFTHLSARIPGEEDTFLINNFGEMFEEVTASSLTKMDMDGKCKKGPPTPRPASGRRPAPPRLRRARAAWWR